MGTQTINKATLLRSRGRASRLRLMLSWLCCTGTAGRIGVSSKTGWAEEVARRCLLLAWAIGVAGGVGGCVVRWQDARTGSDITMGTTYVEWQEGPGGVTRRERSVGLIVDFVEPHVSLGYRSQQSVYGREMGEATAEGVVAAYEGRVGGPTTRRSGWGMVSGPRQQSGPDVREGFRVGALAESGDGGEGGTPGHVGIGIFNTKIIKPGESTLVIKRLDDVWEAYRWQPEKEQ